jgi:CRISPR-associated protein Csm1
MPNDGGRALSFEEIAAHSLGDREWLGYLRIDADRIGDSFRTLNGDAARTWGLSRLLQQFFCDAVQSLITSRFPFIYPVYGGGDDLFVIGPWDQALDFACEVSMQFMRETGGKLTFSAGIALAKPRAHILSKSKESEQLLSKAKEERGRLCALGASIRWEIVPGLLKEAKQLAAWHTEGLLKSSFLQNVLELHHRWQADGSQRYKPFLHYQIERNLGERRQSEVRAWARRHFLSSGDMWYFATFLMRYTMLARKREMKEEEAQHA